MYDNALVLGVGITQRPTCLTGTTVSDPYIGSRFVATESNAGQFLLRAQVSGGASTAAGGSGISTVERTLPPPLTTTMVTAYTGQVANN